MSKAGPAGTPVADHIQQSMKDPAFRAEYERLAPFEHVARLVVRRRAKLGLSQQQLAKRMGTTASVISRIESGQHASNLSTLKRIAEALDLRFVIGFEHGPTARPQRDLIPV